MSEFTGLCDLGELELEEGKYADPIHFLSELVKEHGDYVRYRLPMGPFTMLNDPHDVQAVFKSNHLLRTSYVPLALGNGLLTSEGLFWRGQRKIAVPYFTSGRAIQFVPLISSEIETAINIWRPAIDSGQPVDMAESMSLITMRVILQMLFGYSLSEAMKVKLYKAIETMMSDLAGLANLSFTIPCKITKTRQEEFAHALQTTDDLVEDILQQRDAEKDKPEDFLTALMKAVDAETGEPLSRKQIRDEIVTMMMAGNETTAVGISWAWYLLSQHPAVEARLHDELEAVLGGGPLTVKNLQELEWTTWVIKESLRLYPPVWGFIRQADKDLTIGNIQLAKGENTIISPYTVHRHPEYWDEPDSFRPERFSKESFTAKQQLAYVPFGWGKHLCLGMHFALMEAAMVIARVAQQYCVRPVSEKPAVMEPGVTLRIRGGLPVHFEPRN